MPEWWSDLCGFGPEDEFNDAANGDPDSLAGEDEADDEYDEMSDWPDDDEAGDEDEEDE